jgi:hypothetical protein
MRRGNLRKYDSQSGVIRVFLTTSSSRPRPVDLVQSTGLACYEVRRVRDGGQRDRSYCRHLNYEVDAETVAAVENYPRPYCVEPHEN